MPLKNYGVLKGKAIAGKREEGDATPHYQVHMEAGGQHFRIAVNTKSKEYPSELLYLIKDPFRHPVTEGLENLPMGFSDLERSPGGHALDYIRGNLFYRDEMKLLPPSAPGPDNDLADKIEFYVERARTESGAAIYAFGERWGPEQKADKVFRFKPGNGIHDIHMNQGSVGSFASSNGVYQDGGLLFHFPASGTWVAAFFAFQSQSWHSDDTHGDINVPEEFRGYQPSPGEPDFSVEIVAALVNPAGPAPERERETVSFLNASPDPVDVEGWKIADKMKNKMDISGTIQPGEVLRVVLDPAKLQLSNKGGIITLLNREGLKVDGVSYTKQDAEREGWTIVF